MKTVVNQLWRQSETSPNQTTFKYKFFSFKVLKMLKLIYNNNICHMPIKLLMLLRKICCTIKLKE